MLGRLSIMKIAKSHGSRLLHTFKRGHATSTRPRTDDNILFCYTNGRWLWNERQQQEARYRRFDVHSLQRAACRAVGVEKCVSLEKIGEGNYNKAYRLVMDDGRKVIAKIPHPNAGPQTSTTESEVATMDFALTVLDLPVPKVFAWCATNQNPVEAEYIIMEEARGSQLHEVWEDLPLRTKVDIIYEIVEMERKLLSISFEKLGSLYFHDSGVHGCKPAVTRNGYGDVLDHIKSRYCIGPITRREFWEQERSRLQYHGPWESSVEYLKSIAHREIDWINSCADSEKVKDTPWQYTSSQQRSPDAHTSLLRKFLCAIPHIVPQDQELASPRLWHPDLHAGNIYVDEQFHITSIIDWQGAWTTPVIIGANPPPLLDYGIDILMKLPEDLKTFDEATQEQIRYQVAQSILISAYEIATAEKNPLMSKAMRHPHGQTLKQLEAFAGSTWDNGLYPFEECLIQVENEWEHFHIDQPCPYHFSTEEVHRHYEEAKAFNKSQELWKGLRGILTNEGYTSNETFPKAVETIQELRDFGLANMTGEEREDFEKETRWAEDLADQ